MQHKQLSALLLASLIALSASAQAGEYRLVSTVKGLSSGAPTTGEEEAAVDDSLAEVCDGLEAEEIWRHVGNGTRGYRPVIDAGGVAYYGTATGDIYAVGPDGSRLWHNSQGNSRVVDTALGPDGMLYAIEWDARLRKLDPQTGVQHYRLSISGDSYALAASADGRIAHSSFTNATRVQLRDPGGTVIAAYSGTIANQAAMAFDDAGDLYVLGSGASGGLVKLRQNGTGIDELWRTAAVANAHYLRVMPNGDLLTVGRESDTALWVRRHAAADGALLSAHLAEGTPARAEDASIDAHGNVYAAAGAWAAKFDPAGALVWQADLTSGGNVNGIRIGPQGGVYFGHGGGHLVHVEQFACQ
ncbi:streptogramin lyase [Natronocella acetinitrilica]|uniref:Streptogramin lyase n=1 Tax=Natronocella acetinitrilica TaxID=414046 RepID=A0AAE3KBZ9_9GAMM|nr:PQQ-binding-like beta-propeller repeat protein [Natronocella acetinitrilica]MCP1674328.1 streptogramin lyase [Natronocella acetinitrilica]